MRTHSIVRMACVLSVAAPTLVLADGTPYRLDAESEFIWQPCLGPCACVSPPRLGAMRGTFELELVSIGDVTNFYNVNSVVFSANVEGLPFSLVGSGRYFESTRIGNFHRIELDLSINGNTPPAHFESDFDAPLGRLFTAIDIDARTPVIGCDQFTVRIRSRPVCSADFDGDGDTGTDSDIEAFFRCLGGTCCEACPPDADFNGDGDVGTDADIEAFFRVLSGGVC